MKRLVSVILAILILCCTLIPVSVAGGKVTYKGRADQFIFEPGSKYSPTDLFAEFKDVMPGDIITEKLTVRNEASNDVKVMIYVRSVGSNDDSADFLSQLSLTVKTSEKNKMAYMFDPAKDGKPISTDWVYLGTLYSGGEVNIDVTLNVPIEMENTFADKIGYFDWEFKIDEFPVEEDDPDVPQTGDKNNYVFPVLLIIISIVVILIIFGRKRKV